MQVLPDEIMRDPGANADRHLAITGGIPRQCHAGIQILVVVRHAGFAMKSGILGIRETRRRVRDDSASLASLEPGQAEAINIALFELHREEWLPPDAVCHGPFGRNLPRILPIKT